MSDADQRPSEDSYPDERCRSILELLYEFQKAGVVQVVNLDDLSPKARKIFEAQQGHYKWPLGVPHAGPYMHGKRRRFKCGVPHDIIAAILECEPDDALIDLQLLVDDGFAKELARKSEHVGMLLTLSDGKIIHSRNQLGKGTDGKLVHANTIIVRTPITGPNGGKKKAPRVRLCGGDGVSQSIQFRITASGCRLVRNARSTATQHSNSGKRQESKRGPGRPPANKTTVDENERMRVDWKASGSTIAAFASDRKENESEIKKMIKAAQDRRRNHGQ